MNPDEWKDYQQLKKIYDLCEEASSWNGPIIFNEVQQKISPFFTQLRLDIGYRIVQEKVDSEKGEK